MSLFESFLGGAAEAGSNMLQTQMKNEAAEEQAKRMAKFQEEIAIERMKTIAEMKRAMDLKAGQEISAESERIGAEKDAKNKQVMQDDPELNGMQPGDVETIAKARPAQLKEVGLMDTYSRSGEYDNRATAAENLGYSEEAKVARGQQQIENARDVNERLIASGEARDKHQMRRDGIADKRADNKDAYDNKHLDEVIRHNKALEGAALARTGTEKLSPAAKVQLEIASAGLGSAQKQEQEAAKAYSVAMNGMDPEAKAAAKADLVAAKAGVTMAMRHYSETGKAHLGDGWKELGTAAPAAAKKVYPKPPDGAVKDLMSNPKLLKEFESKFGNGAVPLEFYQQNEAPKSGSIVASSRVGSGERNTYVDAKGRPVRVRVEGDDTSALDRNLPKVKEAIKSGFDSVSNAADAAQVRYLKQKIAEGSLSPAEKVRAKRFGLID